MQIMQGTLASLMLGPRRPILAAVCMTRDFRRVAIMAEYDNRVRSYGASSDVAIDAGLRAYMLRVYNYMLMGLALTGGTAFLVDNTPLGRLFFSVTPAGQIAGITALGLIAMIAPIGFAFFWMFRL